MPRRIRIMQLSLLLLSLALWEGIARAGLLSPLLFPSLGTMAATFHRSIVAGEFAHHLLRTLLEILIALAVATAVGVSVGVAVGLFKRLREIFQPLLIVAFCIPLVAFIPFFIVLFGIEMKSKVVFATLYGFFPICLTTISAIASVDSTLLILGRSLGGSPHGIVRRIVLPAALPGIVAGVEQGMALVIIGTVASEMFASVFGLGYLIQYSFTLFEIPKLYAMAFVTLVIAFALNVGFRRALALMLMRAHHSHPSIEG